MHRPLFQYRVGVIPSYSLSCFTRTNQLLGFPGAAGSSLTVTRSHSQLTRTGECRALSNLWSCCQQSGEGYIKVALKLAHRSSSLTSVGKLIGSFPLQHGRITEYIKLTGRPNAPIPLPSLAMLSHFQSCPEVYHTVKPLYEPKYITSMLMKWQAVPAYKQAAMHAKFKATS
jgi:hypothetical protein